MPSVDPYDVIVAGAGNAALCAAINAHHQGARVLVLEKAPEEEKGGNSYFTAGGFRFTHNGLDDVCQDVMPDLSDAEREQMILPTHDRQFFYDTLMKVTRHQADEELAWILIDESRDAMAWLRENGVRFIPMYGRQSYEVDGKQHFYGGVNIEAVGGGAGLVTFLLERAAKLGIEIRYQTGATKLIQDQDYKISGVTVRGPEGYEDIPCRSVVLACGGFESNPEMRVRYLGPGWDLCRVRGTRHNTGDGINMALAIGAQSLFVDEGEDYRNLTYVRFGKAIMAQPHRTAVQIFDQKTVHRLRDEYRIREVTKVEADTIEELAEGLDINPGKLRATIDAYNAACGADADYNPAILDGVTTSGLSPNKTNWALPIDKPPYVAYVTTTGITFTFGGVKINDKNEVQDITDRTIPGLYAAGELVGGLFYENYPGGTGLMSGAVFGQRAGKFAADYARTRN